MSIQTFVSRSTSALAVRLVAASCVGLACMASASAATTLERIKAAGVIKLGYFPNAKPFTSRNSAGAVEGFSVDLCQQIAAQVKSRLQSPDLKVEWVDVGGLGGDIPKIVDGSIDLVCTPAAQTLLRREDVSYSIPIFPAGVRAVVSKDAPKALREALGEGSKTGQKVVWRGSPAATTLEQLNFAVMIGTTTQAWLANRMATFELKGKVIEVASYASGLKAVIDGKADAFFGDRAVALAAMDEVGSQNLVILDRMMTQEAIGMLLPRNDDEFRLLVDTALSDTYRSAEFPGMYQKWFGKPDEMTRNFFQWIALPH